MANKNVYFHKVTLYDTSTKREVDVSRVRELYQEVFKDNCVNESLLLDEGVSGENQITMDILKDNTRFLFGRLGKVKENSALQFREFKTLAKEEVLNPTQKHAKGVEIFTYFLLDYEKGIFSLISGQSAPKAKIVNNILQKYNSDYYTEIVSIADPNSVRLLFKKGSTLAEVSYTVAVPDSQILGAMSLGREQIIQLRKTDMHEVKIVLKNETRKPMTKDVNVIKNVVESFKESKQLFKKVSFKGKTRREKTKEYPLDERPFTYAVDIPTYVIENYKPVYFDRRDIDNHYFENMYMAYKNSKVELLQLANRYR